MQLADIYHVLPIGCCLCHVATGCDAVSAAKVLVPDCVEPALLVNALVSVGAKEVTLGLRGQEGLSGLGAEGQKASGIESRAGQLIQPGMQCS